MYINNVVCVIFQISLSYTVQLHSPSSTCTRFSSASCGHLPDCCSGQLLLSTIAQNGALRGWNSTLKCRPCVRVVGHGSFSLVATSSSCVVSELVHGGSNCRTFWPQRISSATNMEGTTRVELKHSYQWPQRLDVLTGDDNKNIFHSVFILFCHQHTHLRGHSCCI